MRSTAARPTDPAGDDGDVSGGGADAYPPAPPGRTAPVQGESSPGRVVDSRSVAWSRRVLLRAARPRPPAGLVGFVTRRKPPRVFNLRRPSARSGGVSCGSRRSQVVSGTVLPPPRPLHAGDPGPAGAELDRDLVRQAPPSLADGTSRRNSGEYARVRRPPLIATTAAAPHSRRRRPWRRAPAVPRPCPGRVCAEVCRATEADQPGASRRCSPGTRMTDSGSHRGPARNRREPRFPRT